MAHEEFKSANQLYKKNKKIKINVYSNDLPLFTHGKIKGAVVWS